MSLNQLQGSLLVLMALKNQLEPALRAVKRHLQDDDLKFTVTNHLLILVSSFLSEWQNFEALGADPHVQKTLQSAKPAIKRIRKWKGITKLRSSVLAHGFRMKDGSITRMGYLFERDRAPSAYAESMLLGECAVYAIATAICQHNQIYKEGLSQWYENGPEKIPINGIENMKDFEEEIARIRIQITDTDPLLEKCLNGSA